MLRRLGSEVRYIRGTRGEMRGDGVEAETKRGMAKERLESYLYTKKTKEQGTRSSAARKAGESRVPWEILRYNQTVKECGRDQGGP